MNGVEEPKPPRETVRAIFTRGIVVIIPVVITIWVLNSLFNVVDGIISPLLDHALERHIPGLGFITMVFVILLVGVLSRNLIGHWLLKGLERIIASIPLARTIYKSMKDVVGALQLGGKGRSFRQVVLVEYPRQGLYTIGFVTNEMTFNNGFASDVMVSVYILNPPNPTSGLMILVPKAEARVLDMTVETGLKMALSAGIVTPGVLAFKEEPNEPFTTGRTA